ncbi:MAG: anaerobic ribonucleoside-triphosphate reductase activating protein [Methanosarcina sp.]
MVNIMKVNYADAIPFSTLDWRGKAAVTIFFRGCPFRCLYCQNHPFLGEQRLVDLEFVEEQIRNSRPFVSSVVFSGGEPLMQKAIIPLAEFSKELGLSVGIHTNGIYPNMAAELVKRNLVDKFFVDVKAPFDLPELYMKVAGLKNSEKPEKPEKNLEKNSEELIEAIKKTIEIADSCCSELELRTTLIRGLIGNKQEIASLATWISENVQNKEVIYVLQQGIPEHCLQVSLRKTQILEREELYELGKTAKTFLKNVRIRTREFGEEIVS